MDGMMDSSMNMDGGQNDMSTPSPSFANRPNPGQPGTPMMDMNSSVPRPQSMEDMHRLYAVSIDTPAEPVEDDPRQ